MPDANLPALYPVSLRLGGCDRCEYQKDFTVTSLRAQQQWEAHYVHEHWLTCDGELALTVPIEERA